MIFVFMANLMRFLLAMVMTVLAVTPAMAQQTEFSKRVRASLVFRKDPEGAKHYGYPHVLLVYLRIENISDSSIRWYGNSVTDIEAELLNQTAMPISTGPVVESITSGDSCYLLPSRSRLDWLISNGGITLGGDRRGKYALLVGGQGWLIPMDSAESYSLHVRLRGLPGLINESEVASMPKNMPREILLDVPPAPIEITK